MLTSREVILRLEAAGWLLARVRGDHHQFKHAERPQVVTVPHPKRDLAIGTLRDIEKKSGVKMRD